MSIFKELLINFLRKMFLRFVNNIQNKILTTYHITIDFQTKENKPSYYRLELLAELRSDLEKELLINQLKNQIGFKFNGCNHYAYEVKTQYERERIEKDFNSKLKNHISMDFIFRQWVTTFRGTDPIGYKTISIIDNLVPKNGVKDYRVNILKNGEMSFGQYKDFFCIEIDTADFKPIIKEEHNR